MDTTHSAAISNLYRIVSFDRAVQMLKADELYFSHPSVWDDPYEVELEHLRSKNIFAQCWSRKAQSDALWRIYSPHGVGVRIGTTRELLQQAIDAAKAMKDIHFKIQNVKYLWKEMLDLKLDLIAKKFKSKPTVSAVISPLFLKRDAFSHEKETRVVVLDNAATGDTPHKGFIIKADTRRLLIDIYIDPRAPQAYVEAFTLYLKEQLKFPGIVEKSSLYADRDVPK